MCARDAIDIDACKSIGFGMVHVLRRPQGTREWDWSTTQRQTKIKAFLRHSGHRTRTARLHTQGPHSETIEEFDTAYYFSVSWHRPNTSCSFGCASVTLSTILLCTKTLVFLTSDIWHLYLLLKLDVLFVLPENALPMHEKFTVGKAFLNSAFSLIADMNRHARLWRHYCDIIVSYKGAIQAHSTVYLEPEGKLVLETLAWFVLCQSS